MKNPLFLFFVGIIIVFNPFHTNLLSQNNKIEIVANSTIHYDRIISIVCHVVNDDLSINTAISGEFDLVSVPPALDVDKIEIIRGVGILTAKVITEEDFSISVNGFDGQKDIILETISWTYTVENQITSNTTWTSDMMYFIYENTDVIEGVTLTIEEGTRVFLEENVNLSIYGAIRILGSKSNPVSFQSTNTNYKWGGLQLFNENDSSIIQYTFFIQGGNNQDYIFGHSNSQPVIFVENSRLSMQHCYMSDNPGKVIGGSQSIIDISDCVFSRCDTGGEYHSCFVEINDSYYLNIPNNDGFPADDDNDASYFSGVLPGLNSFSEINDCVFINGKDDAIDHNGANLKISNCWIEGFDHEGIATSNSNTVLVNNTLIKNCEQGMEAGYGSPELIINHCVFVDNDVGIRFGDSYNWGSEGQIMALNSILFNNEDNIYNYDLLTQGPVEGAIDISYSITNDPDYSDCLVCLNETPLFDENYFLLENSPGIGLATDGGDLGLTNTWIGIESLEEFVINDISISPNPCRDKVKLIFYSVVCEKVTAALYNEIGSLVREKYLQNCNNGKNIFEISTDGLHPGSYYIIVKNNVNVYQTIKFIKI